MNRADARRRVFTFHVGVAMPVIAQPQRHPLLQRQVVWGVQQVVQKLVVDLVEGHPDGILHSLGQVISSAVRQAVRLQTNALAVCRWLKIVGSARVNHNGRVQLER